MFKTFNKVWYKQKILCVSYQVFESFERTLWKASRLSQHKYVFKIPVLVKEIYMAWQTKYSDLWSKFMSNAAKELENWETDIDQKGLIQILLLKPAEWHPVQKVARKLACVK